MLRPSLRPPFRALSARTYSQPPRITRTPKFTPPPPPPPDPKYALFNKLEAAAGSQSSEGKNRLTDKLLRISAGGLILFASVFLIRWELNREQREEEQIHTAVTFDTRFAMPTKADPSNVRVDTWKLITQARANRILKADETSETVDRPGNPIVRFDTSLLKSNAQMEDRNAHAILQGVDGDMCFFAVFDGHSGHQTSQLLSKTLIPSTLLSLQSLLSHQPSPFATDLPGDKPGSAPSGSAFGRLKGLFKGEKEGTIGMEEIKEAVREAWAGLDKSIVWDPVDHLSALASNPDLKDISYPTILPALSGSCALLSYVDTARQDMFVALAGDCRAVAGYWVESEEKDGQGKWRVEVLTDDQTGRNPKELKRIQDEHPESEKDTVIMRGRVLGGLEPSRAFGDARYKWSREIQPQLLDTLLPPDSKRPRPVPALSKTPPYVTARPEITHLKLDSSDKEGELRFLVLGTDGLYDRLSNEAVVGLVGAFINEPLLEGEIPRDQILDKVMTVGGGFDGKTSAVQARKSTNQPTFMFGKDLNAATFLIRNSLAGGDDRKMRELLSVGPPVSRYQRDDTTVKVIFFNETPKTDTIFKRPLTWTEWLTRV